jgi:hypothetical protein
VAFGASLALAAGAVISAEGCDPCAGVSNCRPGSHIAISGRLLVRESSKPVAGGRISFIRTSGAKLSSDSISAVSDGDGFFLLSTDAAEDGAVRGRLRVEPPNATTYTVPEVVAQTSRVAGEGTDLGRIVSDPFLNFIGEIQDRLTNKVIPLSDIVFKRTGGIDIQPSTISVQADRSGRFFLAPKALGVGAVTGNVIVSAPGYPGELFTIPISISTEYRDLSSVGVSVLHLGAALLWSGEVYRRGSNAHIAGIPVDFARTGGIAVTPDHFTVSTNDIGLFPIQPIPSTEGELIGDVTIHSPPPFSPAVIRGVRVTTQQDDSVRSAGRWGFGSQAFGSIEFWYRTTMVPATAGPTVVFHRTSGVATDVDTYSDKINNFGRSGLQLATHDTGSLVGDFEVQLGEPYGTELIKGIRAASREDDAQRFYGVFLVGRWFPQVAQVVDDQTGKPIPGTRISFARTSGVNVTPTPFVVNANSDGYFGIRPQPLADGVAIGDVTVSAPTYRDTVITGVRLQSSQDDTSRFIGTWRLRKP